MSPQSGLIVANLLAEDEWAGHGSLPSRATRKRLALAAALLAVFARSDEDILWLPAPIAPLVARFPVGPSRPAILTVAPSAPPSALMAWAATMTIDALRPAAPALPGPGTGVDWIDWLWARPVAPAAIARRLASRAWALAFADRFGDGLPGARMVRDAADLAAHLATGAAASSPSGSWVLKASWSAAGRERIIVSAEGPSAAQDRWMRRQFARGDALLFEPWMARRADFGCVGFADASGVSLLGTHRQDIDSRGRFQGLTLWPGCHRPTEMAVEELPRDAAERLEASALAVGAALATAGYEGPFGVDAWSHTLADGRSAFNAVGEVNVRCTMGLVARAWVQRLGLAPDGRAWRLRFGPSPVAATTGIILAESVGDGAAWLEPC